MSRPPRRTPLPAVVVVAMLAGLPLAGCSDGYLNEVYGRRGATRSVNGTSVLGEMFEAAGHRVRSWRYLSPSLEEADVIVWAPDRAWNGNRGAPSPDATQWLTDWLQYSEDERTLIYIGRDWEAAPEYWAATKPAAPAAKQPLFAAREGEALQEEKDRLASTLEPLDCDWFTLQRGRQATDVKQLTGPWADGVDAGKARLRHWSSLDASLHCDTLLADGQGHPLVLEAVYDASEVDWTDRDSRLLLVENGCFLLNGALVNQERRKLAGRLVARVGQAPKRVVFLESDADPPWRETDPDPRPPTGFELFAVWPIGAVLAQLAALGIVYAAARWPIFGVPRKIERPSLTDFGRHIHALGRLLVATRDRSYAVTQLHAYFQTTPAPRPRGDRGDAPGDNQPPPQDTPA